jgi:RNA 2',3'-cyclic 3'-phosphodiesterase
MKIRCFLAIPIPQPILIELEKLQTRLRNFSGGIRWVDPKTIHLTIKFLGELEQSKIDVLQTVVPAALSTVSTIPLRIKSLGVFPSRTRPRIFWTGVFDDSEGNSLLEKTVAQAEDQCHSIGLPRESHPFRPHLTLGRSREGRSVTHLLEAWISESNTFYAGSFKADKIILFQSILHPYGPEHRPIHTFPFTG